MNFFCGSEHLFGRELDKSFGTEITSRILTYGSRKPYGNGLQNFIALQGNFRVTEDAKLDFIPIGSSSVRGRGLISALHG